MDVVAKRGPVRRAAAQLAQLVLHLQHAVDRRRQMPADIGHHVLHRTQVLVIGNVRLGAQLEATELAQRHAGAAWRADQNVTQARHIGTLGQGNLHHDVDRLVTGALLHIAQHVAAQRHRQLAVDRLDGNAATLRLFVVDLKVPVVVRLAHVIVDIHQALGLAEDVGQHAGDLATRVVIRAVHLGDHRLQHRRPRRHFHHREARRAARHQRVNLRARIHRDLVTGAVALIFVQQVELDLGLPRLLAQVVVTHHAIEVERACGADVNLRVHYLGHLPQAVGNAVRHVRSDRQRRALGHVQHHRELGFVVQRQHLHRHPLGVEEGAHNEEHRPHAQLEHARLATVADHRHQDATVETFQPLGFAVLALFGGFQVMHGRAEPAVNRQPGREHEGREQRDAHRHRTEHRDRQHVGPHHAADKAHRQQRTDHRAGRQDGRVAHLAHRIDRGRHVGLVGFQPTPVDVLHHHDGIVHQDAYREDQREQRDPVDGEAQQPGTQNRKQQHHRNDQQHHEGGLERTKRRPHQQEHETGGHEQLEDQIVDLLVGALAVVAGDADLHIVGDQTAAQRVDPLDHIVGHRHAVGAFLFRHRDGDCRHGDSAIRRLGSRTGIKRHGLARVFRALAHCGYIVHIHRHAVVIADLQRVDVIHGRQEGTGHHHAVGAAGFDRVHLRLDIRALNRLGHLADAQAIARETLGEDLDDHLLGAPADHEAVAGVGDFLDVLQHRLGQASQLRVVYVRHAVIVVILLGPQGDVDHRHIVNRFGFDQRELHALRQAVAVGGQLVVDLDQRRLHRLADIELHGHHAAPALGRGVHVIHAFNLEHQAFERLHRQ